MTANGRAADRHRHVPVPDIEGSTQLERRLRELYPAVLAEHQRLLRQAFAAHGGREVDTQGDSFFYVFPGAKAAVDAAAEAQRALASHAWPGGETSASESA